MKQCKKYLAVLMGVILVSLFATVASASAYTALNYTVSYSNGSGACVAPCTVTTQVSPYDSQSQASREEWDFTTNSQGVSTHSDITAPDASHGYYIGQPRQWTYTQPGRHNFRVAVYFANGDFDTQGDSVDVIARSDAPAPIGIRKVGSTRYDVTTPKRYLDTAFSGG